MKNLPIRGRSLAVIAVVVPLLALFAHVAARSGPLAPVAVTIATVETRALEPARFGIGTVGVGDTFRIGPTAPGRLARLDVDVGDRVQAGQWLGEMDPVDLDARMAAQDAATRRAQAGVDEAAARHGYASAQAARYEQLLTRHTVSEELVETRRHELRVAEAALATARQELARLRAEREAVQAQQQHLRLLAPVDGLVIARHVDPGTTVVAGQAVVEIVDPTRLWIDARFDQVSAGGLAADRPATVVLRSRPDEPLDARVLRVEPSADPITEEILAKIVFERLPEPLPPLGELAEVTVRLPPLPAAAAIPNAAVRHVDGVTGVWTVTDDGPQFMPVRLGAGDLDGTVQVRDGLAPGTPVIVYSERPLRADSRIRIVERLAGTAP